MEQATESVARSDRRYDDPAMREAYAEGMEFAEQNPARTGEDRYDLDPAAAAWARGRVEQVIERIEQQAAWLDERGRSDEATGMRKSLWLIRRNLIGGEGCVVAAFDHRLADILSDLR